MLIVCFLLFNRFSYVLRNNYHKLENRHFILLNMFLKGLGNIVQMSDSGAIKGSDFNARCTIKDNQKI